MKWKSQRIVDDLCRNELSPAVWSLEVILLVETIRNLGYHHEYYRQLESFLTQVEFTMADPQT
jgi:hypothetical protein